jgi:hypothetical protein
MSVVIVTKKCYLLCERVNNITLQEESEHMSGQMLPYWSINIDFDPIPLSTANNASFRGNREQDTVVVIKVGDKKNAYELFNLIVNQIREQIPDSLFLSSLVDKFLTEGALDEESIVGKYEKISGTRKAKRRGKKVLRKTKRSNRSSRK